MNKNAAAKDIPFLDLNRQYLDIKKEVLAKIEEVLDSTSFSGGIYIEAFEKKFARFCHTPYAVALNSGTSALHLSMLALGINAGDEVIVPANTFIATALAVTYTGATPVFVDCHPETWQIDASKIEENITKKTKAIIGVHLYGQPFDVDAVKAIADHYGLVLVEDAAQAHGALYKNRKVGSLGEMACFSFYPSKNLGTYGEGGAITLNNESFYRHLQHLRNYGSPAKYYHHEVGYNMRMGSIEAAILDVKLKYLDAWNKRRAEIAALYQNGITNPQIVMQQQPSFSQSVYHLFVITTSCRDHLMEYLRKQGILPGLHYPLPCHLQKVYTELGYSEGDLPYAEYVANHCLSLPMYAELTNEEVQRVIDVLNKYSCQRRY